MKKIALLLVLVLTVSCCFVACNLDLENSLDDFTGSINQEQNAAQVQISTPTPEPTPDGTPFSYEGITLYLPEGYTVDNSGSIPIIYTPEETGDNMNIVKSSKDSIANQQKSAYEDYYKTLFDSFSGITTFEKTTYKDVDTLIFSYSCAFGGIPMNQTQYLFFMKDRTIIITLTDVTGQYNQEFASIMNTLAFN